MQSLDIISFVILIVQSIFIIRFHFELAKINAFIKPSIILRKITNFPILQIRKMLPSGGVFKFIRRALPIAMAFILGVVVVLVMVQILPEINSNLKGAAIFSFGSLIKNWFNVIQYSIFAYVILSWIQTPQTQKYYLLLHQFLSPLLDPIRKVIPSFSGIDFTPIILIFALSAAGNLISSLLQ